MAPLAARGLVDEVVVIDADSADGTAELAAARPAPESSSRTRSASDLGPALGKGDAMWRGLQATGGDVVCFLDGDTADPAPSICSGCSARC